MINDWMTKLGAKYSEYANNRKKNIIKYIEAREEAFNVEVKPFEDAAKKAEIIIRKMNKAISELKTPFLDNAQR